MLQDQNDLLRQIADLKAENEALRRAQAHAQTQCDLATTMLNTYVGSVWYIDTHYRLLAYNALFLQDMQHYVGHVPYPGESIFGTENQDTENVRFWHSQYEKVLQGDTAIFSFPFEVKEVGKYYECRLLPVRNSANEIIGICGFKVDITQRKVAEMRMQLHQERFSFAQKLAKVGMWTFYVKLKEIHLSPEMQRIMELEPPYQSPLVMPISQFQSQYVHPSSQILFSAEVNHSVEKKNKLGYESKYEYHLRTAKGNEKIILVKRKVVRKGVLEGVSQDITDFRTIERQHAQMTNDLLQKVKDSEQFTYIVSHNLRSPVARLLGLSSLFQTENPNSENNAFIVKTIQKVVGQLDTVITDLNVILSLKNNSTEGLEIMDLAALLEDVKEFVRSDIEKTGAVMRIDVSRTSHILAIPSYAHSVFTNFLTNALKYRHPERAPVISINSFPTRTHIRVDVSDNGMGMDMEKVKDRLFSPYSRFHTQAKIEGKGLGLFLVKTQVEAMGGKIEIQSHLGVGTTFFIYFPIHR